MELNLQTPVDTPETYNFSTPWPQISPEIAANKAARASYGLQSVMDYPTVRNYLDSGDENGLRNIASAKVNQANSINTAESLRQGLINDLSAVNSPATPPSVLEEQYGKKVFDNFHSAPGEDVEDDNGTFSKMAAEHPELVAASLGIGTETWAWGDKIYNRLQEASKAAEDMSNNERDFSLLKDMLGVTTLYTERGVVPGTFWKGGLIGSNLEAQRQALQNLPFKERMETFDQVMDSLMQSNPRAAVHFASYMYQPSVRKQQLDNMFNTLDVSAVASTGKALVRAGLYKAELGRMMWEVNKRQAEAATGNVEAVALDGVGRPDLAGIKTAADDITKQVLRIDNPKEQMDESLKGVFQPNIAEMDKGGPGQVGDVVKNRILTNAKYTIDKLVFLSAQASRVLRIGQALASETVVKGVYKEMMESHPWLYDNVQSMTPIWYEPHTATFGSHLILGREDGSFFSSVAEAQAMALRKGIPIQSIQGIPLLEPKTGGIISDIPTGKVAAGQTKSLDELLDIASERPDITRKTKADLERLRDIAGGEHVETSTVQWGGQTFTRYRPVNGIFGQGKGFYIAVRVPLIENSPLMRQAVIQTENAAMKNMGWLNKWGLGYARTPDEVLNKQIMINRKLSMYAPALFQHAVKKAMEPYIAAKAPLRGRNWYEVWNNLGEHKALERALENNQKLQKDFHSIPELEAYYLEAEKRLPSKAETEGYFAYKLGQDIDLAFRNLAVTKNMTRLGVERHVISIKNQDGTVSDSPEFMGIVHNHVPDSAETAEGKITSRNDARVLIQQDDGTFRSKRLSNMTTEADQKLLAGVKTGEQRLIQLYNSDLKPLAEFSKDNSYIQYVLTKQTKTKPVGLFELPRKEGGHLEYDYSHYLRQADIEQDGDIFYYKGDKTAMALESNALGGDVKKALEEIQKGLRMGGREGITYAKAAYSTARLPMSWSDIRRNFKSGAWDLNQPFYVTPKGKTIADVPNHFDQYKLEGNKFRDTSKGGSLAKQFAVDFTGERDAYDVFAMHSLGTKDNPQLAYRPADLIDPYPSMNRALSRIISSTYMDDVKFTSVGDWLERYKGVLDIPEEDIFKNPWAAFNNAKIKNLPGREAAQINAERFQIKAFAGMPNWLDGQIHSFEQAMADFVHTRETLGGKRAALVAKWSFDKAIKAPAFLRSFAYRAGIGFFAPAQLMVQSMTYASIFGIAGFRRAGQGSIGALLHQVSRLPMGEQYLDALDKIAVNLGHFRPGEWKEARNELMKTGFEYVGAETNMLRASLNANKIFKSSWGDVLDAGEFFFNEGERFTRYGAWYTAYAEHRALKPSGRITIQDRNNMLNRADDFSGNMTKASRSAMQMGPMAYPTQFLGYWLRTVEQFTGKRLTGGQKLRMFGVYSAMFGLPVATNLVPGPWQEMINQYAQEKDYVPKGSKIADSFMQGLPYLMLKLATGNDYNFATRYGPGPGHGFDIWSEDPGVWRVLTGPVGDMIGQTLGNVDPMVKAGWAFIQNKPIPKLTIDDAIQPFKIVNSLNMASKLDGALTYQKWMSRNGGVLKDPVSPADAFFMAGSGLQPLGVDRIELFNQKEKQREAEEKNAETLFRTEFRRYSRDSRNKDYASAAEHMNNARWFLEFLNYPVQRRDTLWGEAVRENNMTLEDRMGFNYYLGRGVPAGKEQQLMKQYQLEQQMKKQ